MATGTRTSQRTTSWLRVDGLRIGLRVVLAVATAFGVPDGLRAQSGEDKAAAGHREQVVTGLVAVLRGGPQEVQKAKADLLQAAVTTEELFRVCQGGISWPMPADAVAGWQRRSLVLPTIGDHAFDLFVPSRVLTTGTIRGAIVELHGGVGRSTIASRVGSSGYANQHWMEFAEREGWLILAPLGRKGLEWWSEAGVNNIKAALRELRRWLPLGEAPVWATGFSDGASGCFHLALTEPRWFTGFIAMNGHPRIPAVASGMELYPINFAESQLWVFGTLDDPLYPWADVAPHFAAAAFARRNLRMTVWNDGGHAPVYFESLRSAIIDWMSEGTKTAWPAAFAWHQSSAQSHQGPAWIEELSPRADGVAPVGTEHQVYSTPARMRLGIGLDMARADAGCFVTHVPAGSIGAALGFEIGDEVLELDGRALQRALDFIQATESKRFGEPLSFAVRRGDAIVRKTTSIPEFRPEPLYRRSSPLAVVRGRREGQSLHLEGEGLQRLVIGLPFEAADRRVSQVLQEGTSKPLELIELTPAEFIDRLAATGVWSLIPHRTATATWGR